MANFDTSNLVKAQAILADKYKGPEQRMKPCPAFELLTSNAPILMQSHEDLRTREDRAIEAYMYARTKRNTGNSRSYQHSGTIDDTAKITLAWTTKSDKTSISLKLLDNNVFDFETTLANKLEQCAKNILEDKETEALAYLRAQRATQQPSLKIASFNAANAAVEISADDAAAKKFFALTSEVMNRNYFGRELDIIADSNVNVIAKFLANQGSSNATNFGYQFEGLNIAPSPELDDANYPGGCALVMPAGGVGALNWIPKQNRAGWGDYNSFTGGFGVFKYRGYTFALHGYSQRADTSASNGNAQDVLMEFEMSLDTSFNKAPLSYVTGRTDSVIVEVAQLQ